MPFKRRTLFSPTPVDISSEFFERADAFGNLQGVAAGALQRSRAQYLSDLSHDIGVQTERMKAEHSEDPDAFRAAHEAFGAETVANAPRALRERVLEAVERDRDLALLGIEENVEKAKFKRGQEQHELALHSLMDRAVQANDAGDNHAHASLQQEFNELLAQGEQFTTPKQRAAFKKAFRDSTEAAFVIGQMNQSEDPVAFIQNFKDNPPEGFSEADINKLSGQMLARVRQDLALEELAGAEQAELIEKQRALNASNLELAVSRATEATDYQGLYENVEQAFLKGDITAAKRTQLMKDLDEKVVEAQAVSDAMVAVAASMVGGAKLDPKNDLHVEAVGRTVDEIAPVFEMSPAQRDLASRVIASTGIVPDNVKTYIRTHIHSQGPEAFDAADFLGRMEEQAPFVQDQFSSEERALASRIQQNVVAGMNPETAVESARNTVFATPAEKEARKLVFNSEFRKTAANEIADITEDIDPRFFFEAEPTPEMTAEYINAVQSHYAVNPDIEYAKEQAANDIKAVWGVTNINGRRVMKYAPEVYYGNEDWLAEQFEQEIENGVLVADGQTAREATHGKPSYATTILTEDGALPGPRWRPDFTQTEAYAEEQAAKEKREARMMELAKERRGEIKSFRRDILAAQAQFRESREKLRRDIARRSVE